jgi:hypothetical protein
MLTYADICLMQAMAAYNGLMVLVRDKGDLDERAVRVLAVMHLTDVY